MASAGDVVGHVDVLALRADQAFVERVQDDATYCCGGRAQLAVHVLDQGAVVLDQVGSARDDVKWRVFVGEAVTSSESLAPLAVSVGAFESAVDDRSLLHRPIPVLPGQRNMQREVENPQ